MVIYLQSLASSPSSLGHEALEPPIEGHNQEHYEVEQEVKHYYVEGKLIFLEEPAANLHVDVD